MKPFKAYFQAAVKWAIPVISLFVDYNDSDKGKCAHPGIPFPPKACTG
ncbi:TPA: hypothetical protein ACSP3N_001215 [Aeromonas veronii]